MKYQLEGSNSGYPLCDTPLKCDYCGCEVAEGTASYIPYNRYHSFAACPECAAKEIEKSKEIEEIENL